jgi:hypothetical protein
MGQSSSQLAPTQVPPSASKSWLPFTQRDAAPKKPKKRGRAGDSEEEAERKSKKPKHNESESPKEHKPNRAIPQHRRGTSIKPRGDTTAAEKKTHEDSEQSESDKIVVAQSPSTASQLNIHAPVKKVSGRVKKTNLRFEQASTDVAELGASVVSKKNERADEEQWKDGTIENGIGSPGPCKRKRKKDKDSQEDDNSQPQHIAREDSVNDVAAFNESVSPGNVEMDGVIISPIGRPGPKPKKEKKNKKRKAVETNSQIEVDSSTLPFVTVEPIDYSGENDQIEDDVDNPELLKRKQKNSAAAQASEQNETSPVTHSGRTTVSADGLMMNSVGDPGPQREKKKRKSKEETLTPATAAPDGDDQQTHSRPGPVNTSTMAEEGDYRPQAMRQFQSRDRGTVTGKWTQEETDLADRVFQDFCTDNGISEPELKLKTTDWATVGPLKVKLYEAFPRRTITNIRRHCQRRFSPYEKGVWGEEETQRLKEAYAKHPEEWPQIAKEVERDVQACRDHWKNQVKYEETMDRGAWSISEEAKLVKIVEEAVALIVETTEDPEVKNDPVKAESMINWDEVATKMDGKRNRKRCFEKWRILKRRTKKPQAQNKIAPASESNAERDEQKRSRKQKWLDQEFAKMSPGDVYDALFELMKALNLIARAEFYEESTLWSVIATRRDKNSRFKATSLIRRTYLTAIETYNCKGVRRAEHYHMKIFAVLKKMNKLAKKGKLDLQARTYGPKEQPKPKAEKKVEKKDGLSEDTILNSDDEIETGVTERAKHATSAEDELVIPETQSQQQVAGAEEESEAEVNGQDQESLRSGTPYLTPEDFMDKCKKVGKKQHRAYLKGYGR